MKNLDYKGFKSTRLVSAFIVFAVATALLATSSLNGDQWVTVVQWVFGTYAVSEVGAKGAEAHAGKN